MPESQQQIGHRVLFANSSVKWNVYGWFKIRNERMCLLYCRLLQITLIFTVDTEVFDEIVHWWFTASHISSFVWSQDLSNWFNNLNMLGGPVIRPRLCASSQQWWLSFTSLSDLRFTQASIRLFKPRQALKQRSKPNYLINWLIIHQLLITNNQRSTQVKFYLEGAKSQKE